jgi:dihydrodipicolinate synthase/N-acetylneuraminate lyase
MYEADCAKDYQGMKKVLDQLVPYNRFIAKCVASRRIPTSIETAHGGRATAVYQSVMKKAMELVGLPGGIVREPLENLTGAEVKDLRRALIDSNITVVK